MKLHQQSNGCLLDIYPSLMTSELMDNFPSPNSGHGSSRSASPYRSLVQPVITLDEERAQLIARNLERIRALPVISVPSSRRPIVKRIVKRAPANLAPHSPRRSNRIAAMPKPVAHVQVSRRLQLKVMWGQWCRSNKPKWPS